MYCCSECFTSPYLKIIINSNSSIGNCDYCSSENVSTYNPKELSLFFQGILDLYIVDNKKGDSVELKIESDFKGKIFSEKIISKGKELLKEIISDDYSLYDNIFKNKVTLRHLNDKSNHEKVKPLQISWENFANEIKSTNRFHIQNTLDLPKVENLLKRYKKEISKGKKFFRARLSNNNGFTIDEMQNPPADKAKGGRANPIGISYLYLADQLVTALYEVRASLYDYVSVAEFRLVEQVNIINLSGGTYDPIYLAEQGDLEDFLIHLPFISKLESELSKPRRRSDNELDYLPTQYLSEFIKSLGYDGVQYRSSLYPLGYNIAIFNVGKVKCLNSKVYEIENIELQFNHI